MAAIEAVRDRLVRQAVLGTLGDRTSVVYVSPLKALGNDIQKNLDGPLAEIVALGRSAGYDLHDIRTGVRTGDTLMPARRAMMRRPPPCDRNSSMITEPGSRMKPVRTTRRPFTDGDASLAA